MNSIDARNRVVLITGAASGIGAATANLFGKAGAKVVLVDRDTAGEKGAAAIVASGGQALFVQADVTSESAMRNATDAAVTAYGRLDVLVNNAGMIIRHHRIEDWSIEEFRRVVDINLTSQFIATQAALPAMQGGGNIVTTASSASLNPVMYSPCYAAAKAGLIGLMRSLVPLLSPVSIRSNALLPEVVETPFSAGRSAAAIADHARRYPHGVLQPGDIAQVIFWLAGQAEMTDHYFHVRKAAEGTRLSLVEFPARVSDWKDQPF